MTDIFASAPGKLFLCGEYAVLKDAPAVVMAVDRRATVRIGRGNAEFQTLATPGFSDQEFRFEIRNGNELAWLDEYSDTPELVSAVIAETGFETESPSRVEIDTRAFIDESGSKLGLGSSAAATVALTRALLGDDANVVDVWTTARKAHEFFQGGSGADVAASCFGDVMVYRRDATRKPVRVEWPDDLEFRVFFSGRPASTPVAIERSVSAEVPETDWMSLLDAASLAATAWQEAKSQSILDATLNYRDELRAFDRAGIHSIFAAGHDAMSDAGDKHGVVYKPSGAGGGDCGIALASDPESLDRFAGAVAELGFVTLDIQRDNSGV